MKKIAIISDTHFGHKEIHLFEKRPENFDEVIIRRWNNLIGENDVVIHLGDVSFHSTTDFRKIMARLNGKKILVRGNHDKKSISYYMENGFDFCCDEFKIRSFHGLNIIFSHIPLEVIPDGYINIHGHLHSGTHRPSLYTEKHLLFNPEISGSNLSPLLLETILKKNKNKFDFK